MSVKAQTVDQKVEATPPSLCETAYKVIETERAGLALLMEAMSGETGVAFEAAARLISRCDGRVVVTGMGKSGHIGRKIAGTLASTGTQALFVHPAEASHGDLGMIGTSDVVLALSWSGETPELSDIIIYSRRFSVPLIAFTSLATSSLAKSADIAVVMPRAAEACPNGLAPTTSTVMQLAMGDALAVTLLSARGFTASDFRKFHPGGKLGSQLKRLHEIMRPLLQVATVGLGASVGDALVSMSDRGLSYALVLELDGKLAGIITDGDMRRNMAPNLMARPVAQIMTRTPTTFPPSLMAAEALAQLNARRITAAPIVDELGKAIGGIHVIDFVKGGVM